MRNGTLPSPERKENDELIFSFNVNKDMYKIFGFGFAGIFFMFAVLGMTTAHEDCGVMNPNDSQGVKT